MADSPRTILICSCEDTMPLDAGAIARGCRGAKVLTGRQLCRAELERFRTAANGDTPLTVGCTQEAPLFSETRREPRRPRSSTSTSARPRAGRAMRRSAGPKMAALLAAAAETAPDIPFVSFTSEGVALIYGRDESAIEAANLLKDHLDVTVLIKPPADVTPPRTTDFPVVKGNIRQAKGHLGAFELTVDNYAQPAPSSRGALAFGAGEEQRGVALRSPARSLGRRTAVQRRRPARGLSARRSGRRGRADARRAQGARSGRHLRQAALHRLHRGHLRAFAFAASSAATAASTSARPARSRRPAITWRSTRTSAPAAANARPCARPARHPTRCRRPTP